MMDQQRRDKYNLAMPTPFRPPRREVGAGTKALRGLFVLLGIGAAVVAAIYAYDQEESVWLSVFVGLIALQLISRAVPDVVTEPRKVSRALYFLLGPAIASACFYFSYQAWEKYWLAFLLAAVGAVILTSILAPLLFPGIHREEQEDTRERWSLRT